MVIATLLALALNLSFPASLSPVEKQEIQKTIALIQRGGPFPYTKDGAVFGNRERRLPQKPHGYYREYTVRTPSAPNRGARRIVRGSRGDTWYTRDHYETFLRLDMDTILVITATDGYRHESIETAERVIAQIAARSGAFQVRNVRTASEMPSSLDGVRVVMLVNTTGELPRPPALPEWVAAGGSLVGVHSASDTWHAWPAYIDLLGGEFESHPDQLTAEVVVDDPRHPATAGLRSPHGLFEEFYRFKNFSRDRVNMLLSLRDGSPLAWSRAYGSGRVFYTALGHRDDVWTSNWFQQHLTGGILWALGQEVGPRRRAVTR